MIALIMCSTLVSFGQTNQNKLYLFKSDIIKSDTFFILKDRKYKVYDGTDKIVLADIDLIISNKVNVSVDSLNHMLIESNINSRFKVKNKLTYTPKKFLIYKDENNWFISETCYAKTDFGVLKELNILYSFDKNYRLLK